MNDGVVDVSDDVDVPPSGLTATPRAASSPWATVPQPATSPTSATQLELDSAPFGARSKRTIASSTLPTT